MSSKLWKLDFSVRFYLAGKDAPFCICITLHIPYTLEYFCRTKTRSYEAKRIFFSHSLCHICPSSLVTSYDYSFCCRWHIWSLLEGILSSIVIIVWLLKVLGFNRSKISWTSPLNSSSPKVNFFLHICSLPAVKIYWRKRHFNRIRPFASDTITSQRQNLLMYVTPKTFLVCHRIRVTFFCLS